MSNMWHQSHNYCLLIKSPPCNNSSVTEKQRAVFSPKPKGKVVSLDIDWYSTSTCLHSMRAYIPVCIDKIKEYSVHSF